MKLKLTLIFVLFAFASFAQDLTLAELQRLCNSSWDNGNKTLINKGWEYHDSERDYARGCATITYAYDKNMYDSERASAWFYFYTSDSKVEQVVYSATESAYKSISASLSANGYKKINNDIGYKQITTTYSSKSFILTIKTTTQERAYGGGTFAKHLIYVVRKGGLYDEDNGEKVDYYYGSSTIKSRYTLKDGKLNGKYYEYYENGTTKSIISWVNGVPNGVFTTYNEDGKMRTTGTAVNGIKHGAYTECMDDGGKLVANYKNGEFEGKYTVYYANGKPEIVGNFTNGVKNGFFVEYDEEERKTNEYNLKNGILNGKYTEYNYDDDGNLFGQLTGQYKDDEKDGRWETKVMSGRQLKTLKYSTYSEGILNGEAREWNGGDSVIFCSYTDGELDGKYQVKASFMNLFFSPTDDKDSYITITDGNYSNGKKSGHWTYNNMMTKTEAEGYYIDGNKEGEWNYFVPDFTPTDKFLNKGDTVNVIGEDGRITQEVSEGSNESYNIEMRHSYTKTYKAGKLNGKVVAFNPLWMGKDSINYICHYRNGQKHGHYERHGLLGSILEEGDYYYGKRNGFWKEDSVLVYRSSGNYKNGNRDGVWTYYDFINSAQLQKKCEYKDGKKDGKWEYYDKETGEKTETLNYKQDKLSGQQMKYVNNQISVVDECTNGNTISETIYENGKPKIMYKKMFGKDYSRCLEVTTYKDSITSIIEYSFNNYTDPELFEFKRIVNLDVRHGNYKVIDNTNRTIVSGQFKSNARVGEWMYYFPEQNLKCIEHNGNYVLPLEFTVDGVPYSGQFKNKAIISGQTYNAVYYIKKGLIQKVIYTDPMTGVVVLKEKCKKGIAADGKPMGIYIPYVEKDYVSYGKANDYSAVSKETSSSAGTAYVTNGIIYAPRKTDITVYNINGISVRRVYNVDNLDISELEPGLYIAKVGEETIKFTK